MTNMTNMTPEVTTMTNQANQNPNQVRSAYHARIAKNSLHPDVEEDENTALKRAGRQRIVSENDSGQINGRYGDMVTQQTTDNGSEPGQRYDPAGFTRNCDHCNREYVAKRQTSKFCSGACRTAAHRERRQQAGGGAE